MMEKKNGNYYNGLYMATILLWVIEGLGIRVYGMEKKMEPTILGYLGATLRIHSFIPS